MADRGSKLFDIIQGGLKIPYSGHEKVKLEKREKFIFRAYFLTVKQIVFFAAFIMKFRQCLTPQNLCIPRLLSIDMVMRYLWHLSLANQSQTKGGTCWLCFLLFYAGKILIPAVKTSEYERKLHFRCLGNS